MHPALSIILFTTLSGLGFGLFAWLGLGAVPENARFASTVVAFVLSVAGLSASTLHLGHPERAWRALSQWRSSWLSREGVMAVVTLGLVPIWWFLDYAQGVGIALAIAALLTVYTTSMIYAQMRSVQQWNTPLTTVVFLLMALTGGGLLLALASAYGDGLTNANAIPLAVLLFSVWLVKVRWWQRADSGIEISTTESATQLGAGGTVRMFESPHSGGSYLLKEMGFRVARKHADKLRLIALFAGGAVPFVALWLSLNFAAAATVLMSVALFLHIVGVIAERWLFFAEARHAVTSFYDN